jgi:hypothetical protein
VAVRWPAVFVFLTAWRIDFMARWLALPAMAILLVGSWAVAQEYRVEPTNAGPPAGELSTETADKLSPTGFKVMQGDKRTMCEIWPAKKWEIRSDFKPSDTILYPLPVGSLVGAIRFPRKAADFRGQDIAAGMYTLRYANQPVDGNHVGTFPTRDFLLMLPAADDQSPAPIAEMDLFKTSAKTTESTHPAILPLLKAEGADPLPGIQHVEDKEWWTVRFTDGDAKVVLELIVVGKAAE